MKRHVLAVAAVMLGALLVLGGCNSVREDRSLRALDETLRAYDRLIRWGLFDEALNYVRTRDGRDLEINLENYEGVHVTRLDPQAQALADDNTEARLQNRLQYYLDNAAVVKTTTDNQLWWYDEEAKRWFLDTGLPVFER
ncbi:MAG: hypothetical protein H6978_02000 [Gammaproteobacteria bacterium]|nr:hypothetical protein [Gammaproteobacteria bacterium]